MVEQQYIDLDGLQLCYRTEGSGEPVLLIHGFLGSSLSWRQQMSALATAGCQVLAVDLPGFGDSHQGWEADHSHARYTDICAMFLQAQRTGPTHVIGHSMGGQVALRLAVQNPQLCRTLTVIDGAIYKTPLRALAQMPGGVPLARWLLNRRWRDADRLRHDLNRFSGFALPDDVYTYLQAHYQHRPECRDSVVAHLRDGCPPLPEDQFRQVLLPVHVVWGERDPVFPRRDAERFARALTGTRAPATVTIIPGEGHFPQETASEAVNRALLSFLATCRASRPTSVQM